MKEYIGVDGCKAGWFVVSLSESGSWHFDVHSDFGSVCARYQSAKLILVDIPIGLIESGHDGRQCDAIARRYLGSPRASSIFTPPARLAVDAPNWPTASAINERLTGRRITRQSWAIAPKIREVDLFLRSNKKSRNVVREIHPEILFWALNGRRAMVNRKKRPSGYEERLDVLRRVFGPSDAMAETALSGYRRSVVARDDILDALAAAVTGYLGHGQLSTIPDDVPTDAYGLPMEMVYFLP